VYTREEEEDGTRAAGGFPDPEDSSLTMASRSLVSGSAVSAVAGSVALFIIALSQLPIYHCLPFMSIIHLVSPLYDFRYAVLVVISRKKRFMY
jgi:hypothetical protein